MKRDYAFTGGVTILVVVSYLFTFRIVAHRYGVIGFGEYALTRRALALLAPVAILGADYATARFVAAAIGRARPVQTYLSAALTVMISSAAATAAVLIVFREGLAQLLYGSASYVQLILVLPLLLLGTGLTSVCFNYLRGRGQFLTANALQLLTQGAIPILAVVVGQSLLQALFIMAFGWMLIAVPFILAMRMSFKRFRRHARDILRFGVPRAPGDLLQLGLLAAPGVFAAHLATISLAGLVAFGTSTLTLIGTAMSPLSFILLPTSARMMASEQLPALRRHIVGVLRLIIPAVTLGTIALELSAPRLVRAYLGPSYESGVYVVRVMLLAAPAYALYFALKSVVDARHVRAINTRNMAAAATSFGVGILAIAPFGLTVVSVLGAFVVSIYVLSALTAWEAGKALQIAAPLIDRPDGRPEIEEASIQWVE